MASTKRKAPPVKVVQPTTKKSAKPTIKPRVNETNASVAAVSKVTVARKGNSEAVVEISSDSDSQNDDASMDGMDDKDEKADASEQAKANSLPLCVRSNEDYVSIGNGKRNNKEDEDDANIPDEEPTFGDLIREQETVDVSAMLGLLQSVSEGDMIVADGANNGLSKRSPSLASLGNLLNAALRNNDDTNLELCFNTTTDATWVRNTIQRMDPALAGPLLQKLAARMYRRPGRAQTLIGWVQWTLITHGGALASQPGVTKSLQELHRVLEERARGLNSLLLLKGKLDMLEAQMQLRRGQRGGARLTSEAGALTSGIRSIGGSRRQSSRGRRSSRGAALVGQEEDDVAVYDEGEEVGTRDAVIVAGVAGSAATGSLGVSDEELEEMDDDEADSDDGDDREDEGANDIEEMDAASVVEEDEVDFDDIDEDEEEEEEEDGEDRSIVPPTKMQKKSATTFSKRR
ncbi:small nucleolar ribonucleoprotein complex component [Grosmannia clavigera kw1407]|uniref:Small nucleolar ribonucleoprotein complex component n=1 Tax=Grosmannia clavigera (strain kw1407 / UAMH 11150) TaxID=655863 RepID=F0X7V7_GROCL|nr:small nucleolar ribonucleoprotein complex component [Grosmannia clavigera kw1407]EFX06683.1 small nucleolar ribonucleoprotein complex component [Grosmannia clavigera kw1407]